MFKPYSKTFALVIGISKFADPQLNLAYARSDAEAFAEALKTDFGFDQIWTLYDEQATLSRIKRFFEENLQKTSEDDGVVIFFALHGLTKTSALGEDRGFLVPHDGHPDQLYRNLSLASIRDDYFHMIPAKHIFLIIDACYGGLALRDVVTSRDAPSLDERLVAEFTRRERKVRQVLSAGGKDQRVLDGGLFGRSIFAGRLLEALRSNESVLLANNVATHVLEKVARDALDRHHHQTPQFGYLHGGEGTFVFCRRVGSASREETGAEDGKNQNRTHGTPFEVCPQCGLRNPVGQTFRCRVCGQDHVCRAHYVAAERCCEECAAKRAEERRQAEARTKAEAQRLADAEKARRETEVITKRELEAKAQREAEEKARVAAEEQARREAEEKARREAEEQTRLAAERRARWPKSGQPWENSLGMKFAPVPGSDVLFSIWPIRVQDYEVFVKEERRDWPKPDFKQEPTHPAVNVSWEDARAFCAWLTAKECTELVLDNKQYYRLPADLEWSRAVGLEKESGSTPRERHGNIEGVYPWGTRWPPPPGAGNYHKTLRADAFENTSPVGSFKPNEYGLYDLGGNVWEWCEDWFDDEQKYRVLRGGSWSSDDARLLLSSFRFSFYPSLRRSRNGLRVVLVSGGG